ncbi:OsmC family protein [Salidesulfovibrio brasiliensis]|uniref:OsmC family protein n=1 Tax=Salidesulfovibrio brasiliensis TaxID=221711 RepID=UPI0006D0B399|nr:OsmC family protein [Salidesulfovibrio brasiliensis]
MDKIIDVHFPGGMKVGATMNGHEVITDLPTDEGGENSAPTPFDFFMISLATCAGVYANRFCINHEIPTDGLSIKARCEMADGKPRMERMVLDITLPDGFPEKLRKPLLRTVDQCTVKKNVLEAPEFAMEFTN